MLKGFLSNRGGNIAVIFSLALPTLIGVAGAAAEYARAAALKEDLQSALDAGLLGGMSAPLSSRVEIATALFLDNIDLPEGVEARLAPRFEAIGEERLEGAAGLEIQTIVMRFIGVDALRVDVDGAAVAGAPSPCLAVFGDLRARAFEMAEGARVDAPNCAVHVSGAEGPTAALGRRAVLDATLCVGDRAIEADGAEIRSVRVGCSSGEDPFVDWAPEISAQACSGRAAAASTPTDGTQLVAPGAHCNLRIAGVERVVFERGVHIVHGRLSVEPGVRVEGDGVTFVLANAGSGFGFGPETRVRLTAPRSGAFQDVLIVDATEALGGRFDIAWAEGSQLQGLIHTPGRDVTYALDSRRRTQRLALAARRLSIAPVDLRLEPIRSDAAAAPILVR